MGGRWHAAGRTKSGRVLHVVALGDRITDVAKNLFLFFSNFFYIFIYLYYLVYVNAYLIRFKVLFNSYLIYYDDFV